jgi:hypothetical protein
VSSRAKRTMLGGVALAAVAVLAMPGTAFATPNGSATLTGGSLVLAAPATVHFAATLNGTNQAASADQSIKVTDQTGSASGWQLSLSATQFVNADANPLHVLAPDAVTDFGNDAGNCDAASSCVLADNIAGSESPITVNATPVTIMNASADTGMGAQIWVHTMHLAIPASAHAGSYSSTWVYTLASAV